VANHYIMKDWKQQQIYFMSVKHFWYLQNSDDSGKQSLYADGNADRNQNLIFCSLSYCEPAALKISCKSVWTFLRKVDNRETDKQAGGFLRPDCAPSSECSQFGMPPSFDRSTPPRGRFNYNMPASVVLLQQCHCRNRHRGKLQNI